MVVGAWLLTLLFSSPQENCTSKRLYYMISLHFQPKYNFIISFIGVPFSRAIIFRVMKHPLVEFYQCTTWGYFEGLATRNITVGNETVLLLPGPLALTPTQAADLYHTLFNCQVSQRVNM